MINEEKIQELLSLLFKTKNSDGYCVVRIDCRVICEQIIRQFMLDNFDTPHNELMTRIAELESKVYAYEKIIANSNFAPLVTEAPKAPEKKNGEWIAERFCSNCQFDNTGLMSYFCPNCGADMRGDEE